MNITLKDGFVYTPRWNGNEDKPKEEQIRIHFKFMNGVELIELLGLEKNEQMIKEWEMAVDKVENLLVNGQEISPTEIINSPGLSGLYIEAWAAYRSESEFTEDIKKK
jgi:hypothetical protein